MDKAPRPKIYISGPLTSSGDREENILTANEWHRQLIADGFAPLNPMLSGWVDEDDEIPHEVWMEVDLPWVECSDAVLRLPGESRGGDRECRYAHSIGIPVYYVEDGGYEQMKSDQLEAHR